MSDVLNKEYMLSSVTKIKNVRRHRAQSLRGPTKVMKA